MPLLSTAAEAAILILENLSPSERAVVLNAFGPINLFEGFQEVGYDYNGSDFYTLRVEFSRTLTATEISRVSGCIGYAFKARIRGEELSDPTPIFADNGSPRTILEYSYDSTKTRSDDPDFFAAFDEAETYMQLGTPIRATDRAGRGTKGTRLVEGINDPTVKVRFFVK